MADPVTQVPANSPGATPNNLVIPDPHFEERAQFDEDLASVTNEIVAEFEAANRREELGDDEPIDDPVDEGQVTKPPVQKLEEPDDPAVTRGLDRMVAREVELKAREDRLVAAETKAQAAIAMAEKYKGFKSTEELAAMAIHSPSKVAAALGMDPTTMVRIMLAEQIEASGKPLPPELKEFVKDAADKRWRSDMEAKLAAKDAALSQQNFFNSVHAGGRQYVTTVGDSTPTVKAVAAANADLVYTEIMEEIGKQAQVDAARDPNAQLISYEEAAKRVEARWAPIKAVIGSTAGTDPTKLVPGVKKVTPPQMKPPVRPLASWLQPKENDLEAQGLREATREFHRVETERKRAR